MPLRLSPSKHGQTREASISEIDDLIASSPSPQFIETAKDFRTKYRDGDKVIERCTARSAWDSMMGWAGFELARNGKSVASLTCKMN